MNRLYQNKQYACYAALNVVGLSLKQIKSVTVARNLGATREHQGASVRGWGEGVERTKETKCDARLKVVAH